MTCIMFLGALTLLVILVDTFGVQYTNRLHNTSLLMMMPLPRRHEPVLAAGILSAEPGWQGKACEDRH